jgi:hypothetical protein
MKLVLLVCLLWACASARLQAQIAVAPAAAQAVTFSDADLDQLLGPIALYPDPLLAQLLPAAAQPAEITLADRYLQSGGDPTQIDAQLWSAAVKAVAHYPEVLKWMDDNLAWTTQVGEAFLYQPEQVMASIQRLRGQAQALGNLQSTPQQAVEVDDGNIEIVPANPEIMYVPVYQPSVVYYQAPVYGRPFISFGLGLPIGLWLNHDWDWRNRHLVVWNREHYRPRDWWYRPAHERFQPGVVHNEFHEWRPRNRMAFPAAIHQDRGWEVRPRSEASRVIETHPRANEPVRRIEPARQQQPARTPERRPEIPAQAPRPEPRHEQARVQPVVPRAASPRSAWSPASQPNGALVGVHSTRETRDYSNRGQQSRQVGGAPISRGAPAPAAAPSQTSPPNRNRH